MAWNNGGGGPQGPWGGGPTPPPPEVEKILQMARERFSGSMPHNSKSWPVLGAIAFVLWMATGIYVVGPDEKGVVVRFGRYLETTAPGPHFHLPYPIETVYKPKVTQVGRIEIGYRTRGKAPVDVPTESLMLTGDENIIDIDLSVQFRIKAGEMDAANYLFRVRNPEADPFKVVRNAAETAIRRVVGRNSIDEALTAGKEKIQQFTQQTMQEILDSYESGIQIIAVQLQQVAPPEDVIHAFKDVASAREDRERAINESQGYANDILPKAKGEAARMIQEAEGYKTAKESRAKGDTERFLSLLTEYEKERTVTTTRLYLEAMEEILPHTRKMIVDPKSGLLPLLSLEGTRKEILSRGEDKRSTP